MWRHYGLSSNFALTLLIIWALSSRSVLIFSHLSLPGEAASALQAKQLSHHGGLTERNQGQRLTSTSRLPNTQHGPRNQAARTAMAATFGGSGWDNQHGAAGGITAGWQHRGRRAKASRGEGTEISAAISRPSVRRHNHHPAEGLKPRR